MNNRDPWGKTLRGFDGAARRIPTLSNKTGILRRDAGEPAGEGEQITLAELGVVLEYGTDRIPPRPAYDDAARKHRATWNGLMAQAVREVVTQEYDRAPPSFPPSLEVLGAVMRGDVRDEIPYDAVPNADSTRQRKAERGTIGKKASAPVSEGGKGWGAGPLIDQGNYDNSIKSQGTDGPRVKVTG